MCFFVGMNFHTEKINHSLNVCYCNRYLPPPPTNPTMSSLVVTISEGIKMNNHTKTKIRVGSVVKAKVGELESLLVGEDNKGG